MPFYTGRRTHDNQISPNKPNDSLIDWCYWNELNRSEWQLHVEWSIQWQFDTATRSHNELEDIMPSSLPSLAVFGVAEWRDGVNISRNIQPKYGKWAVDATTTLSAAATTTIITNVVWRQKYYTCTRSDTNIRRNNLTVRWVKNKSRALKVIERFFVGNCHFRRSKYIVRTVVEMRFGREKKRSKRKIGDSKFICSTSWASLIDWQIYRAHRHRGYRAKFARANANSRKKTKSGKNHFSSIFLLFTMPWVSFNTKYRINRK